MRVYQSFVLVIISGFLLILAFPNFSFYPLAFFALVPLLLSVSHSSFKEALFYGLLTGMLFFGGLLYWLLSLTPWVGLPLTILAWALLTLIEALSFAFFAGGTQIVYKNYQSLGRLFFIPAFWVTLEFLRSVGPWGFSWGILGSSQVPNLFLLQMAKVTGAYGISYLLLMFNVLLVELVRLPLRRWRSLSKEIGAVASIFLILFGGGYFLKTKVPKDKSFKVALIQGNIPQEEKWAIAEREKIESSYYQLTRRGAKSGPHLIIWPETALPDFLEGEAAYLKKVKKLIGEANSYLLLGSLHLDAQRKQYNSAFLFSPQGKVEGRYDKIKLVLFGEYVPPYPIFSNIKAIAGLGENITPGKKGTIFSTPKGNFSTLICFESANSFLARRMVAQGAEMLIVLTNDAWFGKTSAAAQHLQLSILRGVENGVYVIQVANSGISALVDPRGRVLKKTKLFEAKILTGKAAFMSTKTLYTHFGSLFPYLFILLSFVALGIPFLKYSIGGVEVQKDGKRLEKVKKHR